MPSQKNRQPWVKWFADDFLGGVIDLSAHDIGVYTILLNLMANQQGPIADDCAWIARRSGTGTRSVQNTLKRLEEDGKIDRRGGFIANEKMLKMIRARQRNAATMSDNARKRWAPFKKSGQQELFSEAEKPTVSSIPKQPLPARNDDRKEKLKEAVKSENPQNSANQGEIRHTQTHTRVLATESSENIQTNKPLNSARAENEKQKSTDWAIDNKMDLAQLFQTVSAVAGFVPRGANGHAQAFELIREWRDHGIDFEQTVLPVIQRIVAQSDDPTSSLKRFDRAIRHEHAKVCAQKNIPDKKFTPAKPVTQFDDEPEEIQKLRETTLKGLGDAAYCALFNHAKLMTTESVKGEKVLSILPRKPFSINQFGAVQAVQPIAIKAGWEKVW